MKRPHQEQATDSCDEWLSTRNKRKISPVSSHPKKRQSLSRPVKSSGVLRLTQNSPPPPQLKTATKQTTIKMFLDKSHLSDKSENEDVKEVVLYESDNCSENSLLEEHLGVDHSEIEDAECDREHDFHSGDREFQNYSCDEDVTCYVNAPKNEVNSISLEEKGYSKYLRKNRDTNGYIPVERSSEKELNSNCNDHLPILESFDTPSASDTDSVPYNSHVTPDNKEILSDSQTAKCRNPLTDKSNFIDSVQADIELDPMLSPAQHDSQKFLSPHKHVSENGQHKLKIPNRKSVISSESNSNLHFRPIQRPELIDSEQADFELDNFSLKY